MLGPPRVEPFENFLGCWKIIYISLYLPLLTPGIRPFPRYPRLRVEFRATRKGWRARILFCFATSLHLRMRGSYRAACLRGGNWVEIVRDGRPALPGETGDLVVTNLCNLGMPFIRYQVGDAAARHPNRHCPCGCAAPMLGAIEVA